MHPAHFWFFSNFIRIMKQKGHQFIILSRDKDCTLELLNKYNLKHQCLSKQKPGKINLIIESIKRLYLTLKIIKKEKPEILTGCMGPIISFAGKLTKTPSYVFYENETAPTNKLVYKCCTKFITPKSYKGEVPQEKHMTYSGYQQLAFLHPDYFKHEGKKHNILIRLVSKESSHDPKKGWITDLKRLKTELKQFTNNLIISTEGESIPHFHEVIADSKLVISESPTVCAEAACLGVPSIYISDSKRGFIDELENKYGLVYQLTEEETLNKLNEILNKDYTENHKRLLKENIDVTGWMVSYFSNLQLQ